MEIIEKRIEEIIPYENNPRQNDKAIEAVAKSIKEFGIQQPIVLDKHNVIIVGHTRLETAKRLGLKSFPCVTAKEMSKKQARAYRIADNKTSDLSIWDNKRLLEELDAIGEDIFTGFDIGELFDHTFDEDRKQATDENEFGVEYEITFKSADKGKIDQIKEMWDGIKNEG